MNVFGWQGPGGPPEITDTPPHLLSPEQCANELAACVRRLARARSRLTRRVSYEVLQHVRQVEGQWEPRARQLAAHLVEWLTPPKTGGAA